MTSENENRQLAKVFLEHSISIKPKNKVLITVSDESGLALAKATYIEALKMGAYPVIDFNEPDLSYQFFSRANQWQLNYFPKEILKAKIDWADAYIRIAGYKNSHELNQIDTELITNRSKLFRPIIDKMIDSDRWVLTEFPSFGMAQDACVSLDWLTEFYFKACLVDYKKMQKELLKLEKIMDQGKIAHIFGQKTDLTLGIAGRLAKACYGERNIPDGEVFLAPLKTKINGHIYFELITEILGHDIKGVYLEFKEGRVVKASADQGQDTLEKVLKTDAGAQYLGEFAIGANYQIKEPMKNTLFDEKIGGTVHLALGRSYREKRGGAPVDYNESVIHWDIVKDTRINGSFVEIDGNKILKNGKILV